MRLTLQLVTAALLTIGLSPLAPAQVQPAEPPETGQAFVTVAHPVPSAERPLPVHAFWDRTNIALFSGVAISRGLDYASTQNFLARGREEILIPDDIVDNPAGFAALEVASTAASIGVSYIMHRTGHHKIERWVSIVHIGVTTFGAARNYSLESSHTAQ
jgi:hypothetical protein